jgi:hypothetical protein
MGDRHIFRMHRLADNSIFCSHIGSNNWDPNRNKPIVGRGSPMAEEAVTRALHRLLADETVTQALHRLLLEERDTEQARELFIAFGSTVEGGAVESAVEGGGAVVKPDPPPAPLSEEAALEVEIADLHTMLEIERRRQRGGDQSTRCPPPPVDGPPPLLPAPILSYWQWRVGALHGGAQSADLGRIAELFAQLEIAMGRWQELDDRLPLIQALMPHGQWQGLRKMLSYDGAIGGRDLTNYVYGAGIQLFCKHLGGADWRLETLPHLNNERNGDIVEAILGLHWNRQRGIRQEVMEHVTLAQLDEYVSVMAEALLLMEQAINTCARLGIWVSAPEIAKCCAGLWSAGHASVTLFSSPNRPCRNWPLVFVPPPPGASRGRRVSPPSNPSPA